MTVLADRRSVLAGLAMIGPVSLGLGGCNRERTVSAPRTDDPNAPTNKPLDLSDLERTHGGRIGFSARDMNQLSWRGTERFNYCSTFKLFLAAATFDRVEHEEERLDRSIPITAADRVANSPVTEPMIGKSMTIRELMQATVETSDNIAANILIRELGGLDALRSWYRGIGDTVTRVDRMEPFMNRPDGDKDTTQPDQIVANLGWMLDTYDPLGFQSDFKPLWDWMIAASTGPNRIKAGVPEGWTVAHKTGTGGSGQTNDIGVIYPPSGEPIRIAIYYDATATLDVAAREGVLAEVTRRAIRALGRDTPATPDGPATA